MAHVLYVSRTTPWLAFVASCGTAPACFANARYEIHFLHRDEVRACRDRLRGGEITASLGPNRGEIAADVFADLSEGMSPVDVVKKRRVPTDVVKTLVGDFADLSGELRLSPDLVSRLSRLIGVSSKGLDGESLTSRLESLVKMEREHRAVAETLAKSLDVPKVTKKVKCTRCGQTASPVICGSCVAAANPLSDYYVQLDEAASTIRVTVSAELPDGSGEAVHFTAALDSVAATQLAKSLVAAGRVPGSRPPRAVSRHGAEAAPTSASLPSDSPEAVDDHAAGIRALARQLNLSPDQIAAVRAVIPRQQ